MSYRFIVHIVDRPDIKPQKVQDFYELVNQGSRIYITKWMNQKNNSMLFRGGEVTLVDMYGCLEVTDEGECIISDNDDADLSMIEQCFSVRVLDTFDLGQGTEIGNYILSDFFWKHGVSVRTNCLYGLDSEQIETIDKQVVGLNLRQKLSADVAVAVEFR